MSQSFRRCLLVLAVVSVAFAFPAATAANHSWGGYHWARTTNPFTLKLGDNLADTWDPYLATTSSDWSQSSVLDTTIVTGGTKPRPCRATSGRVEVCNAAYGNTGWLGVAQIWVSGLHIAQGTVKVNDYYFNTSPYNSPAWRNLVMCQEVGHTFGLDHQDEDFYNPPLGTCMDYTSDPTPNQHPNAHDYEELEIIYAHLDSTTTVGQSTLGAGAGAAAEGQWGVLVATSNGGRTAVYALEAIGGVTVFTFVIFA